MPLVMSFFGSVSFSLALNVMSAHAKVLSQPDSSIQINTVHIFPLIGIVRVGNSVDKNGWFYGPEVPGRFDELEGGFKDAHGAVK
jgi:hypothetical protein